MRTCSICGAEAREGAKFCTSCGARLDEAVDQAATEPADDDSPRETPAPANETEANPVATDQDVADTLAVESETAAPPVEPVESTAEPEEPAVDDAQPAPQSEPEIAATWPAADTASEIDDRPDDAAAEVVTGEAPASFATDADQDPQEDAATTSGWGWPTSASEAADEPVPDESTDEPEGDDSAQWEGVASADSSAEPDWPSTEEPEVAPSTPDDPATTNATDTETVGATTDTDHRGASRWESWASATVGAEVVQEAREDPARAVRGLLNDLANRIDRLMSPAALAARDIDPDELADQLGRWSRSVPNAEVLLEVVQAVRKSPRDLDALSELADHAADLELLVRHYQSITDSAGTWARDLRRERSSSSVSPPEG